MIKSMALEFFNGLMAGYTLEAGKKENSMVWEFILLPRVRLEKLNGKMEKELAKLEIFCLIIQFNIKTIFFNFWICFCLKINNY